MVTVQVAAKMTVDDLVAAANQLPNPELTTFLRRVIDIQSQRGSSSANPENEQALLQLIQQPNLTVREHKRLNLLRKKCEEETLTSEEHRELLQFVERVEAYDYERIKALSTLAKLRQIPLPNLMKELGLTPEDA